MRISKALDGGVSVGGILIGVVWRRGVGDVAGYEFRAFVLLREGEEREKGGKGGGKRDGVAGTGRKGRVGKEGQENCMGNGWQSYLRHAPRAQCLDFRHLHGREARRGCCDEGEDEAKEEDKREERWARHHHSLVRGARYVASEMDGWCRIGRLYIVGKWKRGREERMSTLGNEM